MIKLNKKKLVYFLSWSTSGRDFEMNFPLIYFFEKILKWEVQNISSFNFPKFHKNVPDIIIFPGSGGAQRELEILKYAKSSKIFVFSSFTEGMFREKDIDNFLWGWNLEKIIHENLRMLWSQYSFKMAIKHYPVLKDKLRVSGAIGFDKYRLFNYINNYSSNYDKVICYACHNYNNISKQSIDYDFHLEHLNLSRDVMRYLVNNNKDILFVFKSHPNDQGKTPLESIGLEKMSNVKIVSTPKKSIAELISISDIWINFNSTTVVDAWINDIPTINILKDKSKKTSIVIDGSLIETDKHVINDYISEFYKTGVISKFLEKTNLRSKLISSSIGYSDGLNHIRYMSFLRPYIEEVEKNQTYKKWNISYKSLLREYIKTYIYKISSGKFKTPILRKWASKFHYFNDKEFELEKKNKYPDLDKFYKKNKDEINDIYSNYTIELEKELST